MDPKDYSSHGSREGLKLSPPIHVEEKPYVPVRSVGSDLTPLFLPESPLVILLAPLQLCNPLLFHRPTRERPASGPLLWQFPFPWIPPSYICLPNLTAFFNAFFCALPQSSSPILLLAHHTPHCLNCSVIGLFFHAGPVCSLVCPLHKDGDPSLSCPWTHCRHPVA